MGYVIRMGGHKEGHSSSNPSKISAGRGEGPGTELKKILARFGIRPVGDCKCNRRARRMDQEGIEWCRQNRDRIVGWLQEEAKKRKLPFVRRLGKVLVDRAIRNSEKRQEEKAGSDSSEIVHNEAPAVVKTLRLLKWSYGVTTVPERVDDLLPRTLDSLSSGGFDAPRLFVDGTKEVEGYEERFGLEVTVRSPTLGVFRHWVLTLWELYAREPEMDRYAVFQDDMVTYNRLRDYLDSCQYPEKGYWNLYTFPENQKKAPEDGKVGWFLSNQKGKGAVGLVFSREAVYTLLEQPHIVERLQSAGERRYKAVDGAIVDAFRKTGWSEYVHNPSLIEHVGMKSTLRHNRIPDKWKTRTFRGEDFNAMELLK